MHAVGTQIQTIWQLHMYRIKCILGCSVCFHIRLLLLKLLLQVLNAPCNPIMHCTITIILPQIWS